MTPESLNGLDAKHGVLIRERENLGLFLHHLCKELADRRCEIDADRDRDLAYCDITLAWDLDDTDMDIYVHGRHVVVRLVHLE